MVSARWRGLQTAGVVRFRDVNIRVIFKSASLMLPLSGRQSSTGQRQRGGPSDLQKRVPHICLNSPPQDLQSQLLTQLRRLSTTQKAT